MQSVVKKSLLAAAISASLSPSISSASEDNNVIVITSSRVEMAREQSGSAVTVLDSQYLEQNQIRQVSDALRHIPGIAVNRQGSLGSKTQVRIRGAEGNQTLVLIDGIEVNTVGGSEYNFANLSNLEIDRIEVLRGAQSAIWGSDAMGGVVNIITKKGRGPLLAKVNLEVGSFGTHQESFSLSGGSNKSHYALRGSFIDSDGISVGNEDRGNSEDDGYKNQSFNFKGGIDVTDELTIDLALLQSESESENDGGWTLPVDDNSSYQNEELYGKLSGKLLSSDGKLHQLLAISYGQLEYTYFGDVPPYYVAFSKKRKLEYQGDYYFGVQDSKQRITFLAEHEQEDYDNATTIEELDSTGLAIEYSHNLNDRYFFTVAGRKNYNTLFEDSNTYRLAFSGWANKQIRIHSSKGTGIKNPTVSELYGYSGSYNGNPNLKPEENTTWDLGGEYHFTDIDGYLNLTLFYSEVDNLIEGSGNSSINVDSEVEIKGIELTAVFQPTSQISINGSYTYSDSDDGEGKRLDRRAKHIANLSGSYLYTNNKTRLTGSLQYNSDQRDNYYDEFFNKTPAVLDSYTLLNLAVSHQLNDTVRLYGRVNNLLDDSYEEVYGYGTEGRNFTLGIEITGGL